MPSPKPGKGGADPEFSPFCSKQCKLIDLGAWLNGQYRIVEPDSSRGKKNDED